MLTAAVVHSAVYDHACAIMKYRCLRSGYLTLHINITLNINYSRRARFRHHQRYLLVDARKYLQYLLFVAVYERKRVK